MTQCEMILRHMKEFGSITTFEAFTEYGITRLSGRVHDLRKAGHNINNKPVHRINRYGKKIDFVRYYIEK